MSRCLRRIFISYRRQGNAWPARQLYGVLVEHFPAEQVFKDIDNIEPGDDFVKRMTAAVESCDVLLALIGPQWLTITDEKGQRRLDDPEDYVRLEIEAALKRKIRVIPILVDDVPMPARTSCPPPLPRWSTGRRSRSTPSPSTPNRLITTVQKTLAEEQARRHAEVSPGVTPRKPHNRPGGKPRSAPGKRRRNSRLFCRDLPGARPGCAARARETG